MSNLYLPDFPEPRSNITPRKFYFLEYFYVLVKSVEKSAKQEVIFERFVELKEQYQLGESRYKKKPVNEKSKKRQARFEYTFKQVLAESLDYSLVIRKSDAIYLTSKGEDLLALFEEKPEEFRYTLLSFMEHKHEAFRYIIKSCYNANPKNSGLLIFPIYSPLKLEINRPDLITTGDMKDYFHLLKKRLENDISEYLRQTRDLTKQNEELLQALVSADLLSSNNSKKFDATKYNVIVKRGRDFWLRFFLREMYKFDISLPTFEIWAYRGKQIGVLHITEFYPDPYFSGRVVYPLSKVVVSATTEKFHEVFTYSDGRKLYLHLSQWEKEAYQQEFVRALYDAYRDIRESARTYFVNLPNVREKVCYRLKIPEFTFDKFLGNAYKNKHMKIKISLEVDKHPDETKAMYLQREPVLVDGKYRNIIAIDLS